MAQFVRMRESQKQLNAVLFPRSIYVTTLHIAVAHLPPPILREGSEASRHHFVSSDGRLACYISDPIVVHGDQDRDKILETYVDPLRLLLAARKCVKPVFNPADEKLAAQLFEGHVELKQIWLLNGTAVAIVSGLRYFSSAIQEVQSLEVSDEYWQHLARRVAKFEGEWPRVTRRKAS